ncbi:potassium-transporting ATPase subunit KdpA, partial [Escherichia coli O8:H10]
MAAQAFLLIASFLLVLFLLARPLGTLLARLIADRSLPGTAAIERGIWRITGIQPKEMTWRHYLL